MEDEVVLASLFFFSILTLSPGLPPSPAVATGLEKGMMKGDRLKINMKNDRMPVVQCIV